MSDPKSYQEPSMEEILASIRRIISEDDAITKEGQDSTLRHVAQNPRVEAKEEFTVKQIEDGDRESTEEIEEGLSTVYQTVKPPPDTGLISSPPLNETTSQIYNLANAEGSGKSVGVSERTIEDLVREIMEPMIKEWLNEYLPSLVESLVEREFGRMSRSAADSIDD